MLSGFKACNSTYWDLMGFLFYALYFLRFKFCKSSEIFGMCYLLLSIKNWAYEEKKLVPSWLAIHHYMHFRLFFSCYHYMFLRRNTNHFDDKVSWNNTTSNIQCEMLIKFSKDWSSSKKKSIKWRSLYIAKPRKRIVKIR